MIQDKIKKRTETDPMLEGTNQPGELADTPDFPAGVQDPALFEQGVDQPGELENTPVEPNEQFLKDVKRQVSQETAPRFVLLDVLDDLGLEFNSFEKESK
jgi:hypothetical protein